MASRSTKSWEVVRAELPVDEERVAAYRLIIEAQRRIARARAHAGATDAQIDAALEACEPPDPASLTPGELYLGTLKRFVAALGGSLQGAAAVFGDETIALPALGGGGSLPS